MVQQSVQVPSYTQGGCAEPIPVSSNDLAGEDVKMGSDPENASDTENEHDNNPRRSNREKRGVPGPRFGLPSWFGLLGVTKDNNGESMRDTDPGTNTEEQSCMNIHGPSVNEIEDIPQSFHEAWHGKDSQMWRPSILKELSSLRERRTFTLVSTPETKKTITSKWVFKKKVLANGSKDETL